MWFEIKRVLWEFVLKVLLIRSAVVSAFEVILSLKTGQHNLEPNAVSFLH